MDFLKISTNTFDDIKVKLLRRKHGRDGYLVYIHSLYLISQNITDKNVACELPYASQTISFDLDMEQEEVEKILSSCIEFDLLDGDATGTISCIKILTRLDMNKVSPKTRVIVKKALETKENNIVVQEQPEAIEQFENTENVDNTQENNFNGVNCFINDSSEYEDNSSESEDLSSNIEDESQITTKSDTESQIITKNHNLSQKITNFVISTTTDIRNKKEDIRNKNIYSYVPKSAENGEKNTTSPPQTTTTTHKFTKPTVQDIKNYCIERQNNINAEQFFDYYESKGWVVGKTHMKDWKACVRTWERNEKIFNQPKNNTGPGSFMSKIEGDWTPTNSQLSKLSNGDELLG